MSIYRLAQQLSVLLIVALVSIGTHAAEPAWPWRAVVDESPFLAGGSGTVLHLNGASPAAVDDASAGTLAKPYKTFEAAMARAKIALATTPVKVVVHPTTYRIKTASTFDGTSDAVLRERTLVIEGLAGAGGQLPVLTCSSVAGWEPATWTLVDAARNIYTHTWNQNFFYWFERANLAGRAELVHLTPAGGVMTRMNQVLAENWTVDANGRYTYIGFTDPTSMSDAQFPPGSFAVAELGPGETTTVNTPSGTTTFGALYNHTKGNTMWLRLPGGMTPADFVASMIEVTTNISHILQCRSKSQLVIRRMRFQHCISQRDGIYAPVAINGFESRNIILDQIFSCDNGSRSGLLLWLVRGFSIIDCEFQHNGNEPLSMIAQSGQMQRSVVNNNGWRHGYGWAMAVRNVRFANINASNNGGPGVRMDHVAENLEFNDCTFDNNLHRAVFFEVAIGPVWFRRCSFTNTRKKSGDITESTAVLLATGHQFTFDACTFANNDNDISSYPRERAHVANMHGGDNPANNLDRGEWGGYSEIDQTNSQLSIPGGYDDVSVTPPKVLPAHWKPLNENRGLTVHDCVFSSTSAAHRFFTQHYFKRDAAYQRGMRDELRAWNNTYDSPNNPTPFEGRAGVLMTFAQWKANSTQPNFEAGSYFGSGPNPNPVFTPPAAELAVSGAFSTGTASGSSLVYEARLLPFSSSASVEVDRTPGASGGMAHLLRTVQVGDYGDEVRYTITVPRADIYEVKVRYYSSTTAWNQRGYHQLLIDGMRVGTYHDQSAPNGWKEIIAGSTALSAGEHTLTMRPVWRHGFQSGSYDLSIDRFVLTGGGASQSKVEVRRGAQLIPWRGLDTITPSTSSNAIQLDYVIHNRGTADLTVGALSLQAAANVNAAILDQPAARVAPGASTIVRLSVMPTVDLAWSVTVNGTTNDSNTPTLAWTIDGSARSGIVSSLSGMSYELSGPVPTGATAVLVDGVAARIANGLWSATTSAAVGTKTITVQVFAADGSFTTRSFSVTR